MKQQITLFPAPNRKRHRTRYRYTMPHPCEDNEPIVTTSVKKAYSAMIGAYPEHKAPKLGKFSKEMRDSNKYEIAYGLCVLRV